LIRSDSLHNFTDTQDRIYSSVYQPFSLAVTSTCKTNVLSNCLQQELGILAVQSSFSFFYGENKTKYFSITGTTARYQGRDGVLQHCKSAVRGWHRHLQHDAASDQQFPALERHSEC
jgi:hypothetical protein